MWGDWLGTGTVAVFNRQFLPFKESRKYARSQKLKGWKNCIYAVAGKHRKYRKFSEAKKLIHKLKLKGQADWNKYSASGKRPSDIPSHPSVYKEWKNWGDWLGTGTVANIEKTFRPFGKAIEYVHTLNIENRNEWYVYAASGNKPEDIPTAPNDVYKNEWKNWGDWLGTGVIAGIHRKFRPFEEARSLAHSLKLEGKEEWSEYCKSGNKPDDIPYNPSRAYRNKGWNGWGDFLGTYRLADQVTGMTIHKVKELIRDLIKKK